MGITAVALWHAKGDSSQSRLNEVIVFPFYTLKKQYGLSTRHVICTQGEKWFFIGRNRFQHFPLLYYGAGRHSDPEGVNVITGDYLIAQNRFLKRIRPNTFAGLQSNIQWLSNVEMTPAGPGQMMMPLPTGGEGNLTTGVGAVCMYDDRLNILNVRHGNYAEVGFTRFSPILGSDFNFSTLVWDARLYRTGVKSNQVIALHTFAQLTNGVAPFNQLAAVGGESILRGYYLGRFRDKQYMAFQMEYRWLPFSFSKRIGGTAFLGTGLIGNKPRELLRNAPLIAGGAGLRVLLFPEKDIYARLDIGLTPEGRGFYLYLGESF